MADTESAHPDVAPPQSRAETIFFAALAKDSSEEQARHVEEACGGDAALRERVDRLLRAHARVGILESPPVAASPDVTLDPPVLSLPSGTVAGRYKLLESIGEGGYGTVFMAEQTSPVHRKVALKIIKAGMETRQVIARFEAERQALALMDHPNIAKVFDAGVTDAGRPYFVMELVKGVPITKYCDEHHLTPRDRLGLFVQVCHAVQHAHQKGIIHRDLKPSNVLLALYDGIPVPKVIDFGVAKATGQQLTERTMFTGFGDVIGTPQYMSPEQAELNQLDVDTRSDIYSLGVLLYELLTGTTPLESKRLKEAALLEVLRVVREEEPPKPSTRLSTVAELPSIAAQRGLEPRKLSGLVHGELDWIVMKALEKDRTRRYETANGFASDIERYLADEPVLACPPSARYRLGKFARRHKAGLLATAGAFAALLLLVAGLAVSNRMIVAERNQTSVALTERERALARAEAEGKRAEANFLRAGIAIREVLTKAAMGSGEWSALPPPLRKRFSEESIKFYESLLREDSLDPNLKYEAAVGHRAIGTLHTTAGEPQDAEKSFRHSVAILERLVTAHPGVPQYRQQLGWSLLNLGRSLRNTKREEAKAAFERAVELYESLLQQTPNSLDYRNELATCYRELSTSRREAGELKPADDTLTRGITMLETAVVEQSDVPEYRERLAQMHYVLGELRKTQGQFEGAKAAFRTAAKRYEDAFTKAQTAPILYNWALSYQELLILPDGDPARAMAEAEEAYRQFLSIESRVPPGLKDHRDLRERFGHVRGFWVERLRRVGRLREAEQVHLEAAAIFEKLTIDEPNVVNYWTFAGDTYRALADAMLDEGRRSEMEQAYRNFEKLRARVPADVKARPDFLLPHGHTIRLFAFTFWRAGRLKEAEERFTEALPLFEKLVKDQPDDSEGWHFLADTQRLIAELLTRRGRHQEAEPKFRRSIELHQQRMTKFPNWVHNEHERERAEAYFDYARMLIRTGRAQEAAPLLGHGIAVNPRRVDFRTTRADLLRESKDLEQAIAAYSDVLTEAPQHANAWVGRALAYLDLQNWERAAADFSEIIERWPEDPRPWYQRGRVYAQTRRADEALADLRQALAKGFTDVESMKADVGLAPLRDNDEFKKLVAAMEEKRK